MEEVENIGELLRGSQIKAEQQALMIEPSLSRGVVVPKAVPGTKPNGLAKSWSRFRCEYQQFKGATLGEPG